MNSGSSSNNVFPHASLPPLRDETEDLPSYEETLETISRKQYILKYPQLLSRTIHAIDSDTGRPRYMKKAKGLSISKTQFYKMDGGAATAAGSLMWSCQRERQGFELVFSRPCASEPQPQSRPASAPEAMLIPPSPAAPDVLMPDLVEDDIGTQVLLDNKEAEQQQQNTREYRNEEAPPPAYEENEPNRLEEIRLTSTNPFPFTYDFTFPEDQGDRLRWARNQEAKDSGEVSEERPWREFICVERLTGRVLAEVVRCTKRDPTLGTLVIHGDLDPGLHELLVFSAVTVIEEYPMRCLAYLGRGES